MLKITVPGIEKWDEERQEFISSKETELTLEHSLVSVSKWESKWHKYFIGNNDLTRDMLLDYIRCMTINQNVDPDVYYALDEDLINEIVEYIKDSHTATWFREEPSNKSNARILTSELIYYWMVALQIPFECQKWHLNRLLTLIRVCNEENTQSDKKMSQSEIMRRNREINEQRRRALKTRG